MTKAVESITTWAAVAQNAVAESGILDCSGHYATELGIQAFLDTTTASTGIEFIVQVSSNTTGDADWHDYTKFTELIGTADSEAIVDNPLTIGSTTINLADTGGLYETPPFAHWLAIEGASIVNSELVLQTGFTINDLITILDGTKIEHAQGVLMFDIAFSNVILLDMSVVRARVVVNNTVDTDGSSCNFQIRCSKVTAV